MPREAGEGDVVVHELGAFRIDREELTHPLPYHTFGIQFDIKVYEKKF